MGDASLLVDLRISQSHRGRGIARYSQGLVLALARQRPDLEIACLIDPAADPPLRLEELAGKTRVVEGRRSIAGKGRPTTHFLQAGLFDQGKPPRILFPPELGQVRPRLAAIVYDLIPWIFPKAYLANSKDRDAYMRVVPVLSRLDRLFAISESVRRDVIAIASADPSRVVTIHGGLEDEFWAPRAEVDRSIDRVPVRVENSQGESFELPDPYWLYVGGDDFRKNLPRLIEAFGLLKRDGGLEAPLVIVCAMRVSRRNELLDLAASLGLQPGTDVVLTGFVHDDGLRDLFSGCLATVFPSMYEGLGLPVVESYASGKPVLASDTSSFRELVPERCRFNPDSAASIAGAIRRFHDDPSIAADSLAFAPTAIELCRWPGAVAKIAAWLDGRARPRPASSPPLWVASSLPPDRSGVAFYTQRSLCAPDRPVTFFAPTSGIADLEVARDLVSRGRLAAQRDAAPVDVLPLSELANVRQSFPELPVAFVLGNSKHHVETLGLLLQGGARANDAVHLHDTSIDNLFAAFATLTGGSSVGVELAASPPVQVLVLKGGIRHFIVNSVAAADRLRLDLGADGADVRIDVLFLPVLPRPKPAPRTVDGTLRIGHFGYLRQGKAPELVVAACDLLAERRRIKLVLAGYGVAGYIRRNGVERPYLEVVDSPPEAQLEDAMAGIDCAVQLRLSDRGESSGVVNELLAIRRPVICTRSGSFLDLDGVVTLVDRDIDARGLALAIEETAAHGWPTEAEPWLAARSSPVFEGKLRQLLDLD